MLCSTHCRLLVPALQKYKSKCVKMKLGKSQSAIGGEVLKEVEMSVIETADVVGALI